MRLRAGLLRDELAARHYHGVGPRRDITNGDLRVAVEAYLVAAGTGPDVLGTVEFADLLEGTVEDTIHFARFWPVGTDVGRRLDHTHRRALPD